MIHMPTITFSDDNARVTVKQLNDVAQGMATKNDARFPNKSTVYTKSEVYSKTETYPKEDLYTKTDLYTKAELYTKSELDGKIASAYKAGGSKTAAQLTNDLLIAANEGKVYNLDEAITTTADFVEGAGKDLPAGTNVTVVEATPASGDTPATYKFDALEGAELVATSADITAIINGIYAE